MHIILGGTGQVGSAAARWLLERGESVTVVTRDASHGKELERAGAQIAVGNIRDVDALREVLRTGTRAFLVNPPADPSGDTDAEERANVAAIVNALEGSALQKVVLQSTYGARPGQRCGDLTVLHGFEERLRAGSIPAAINRGAYYMSNCLGMLDVVRSTGQLPSVFPADLRLPMVAPEDLGQAAGRRLLEPVDDAGIRHVEGPERYTMQDVADALTMALGTPVDVQVVPREGLVDSFFGLGFSIEAAQSYACMTKAVIDGEIEGPSDPERGRTALCNYIQSVVRETK
ncbi:MAG: NAD(P)H-binding protein [Devosia sp.]